MYQKGGKQNKKKINILSSFAFAFAAIGHPDNIGFFGHRMFKKQNVKTKFLSNLLYFVIICSAVFVGEVAVETAYEKAASVKFWDYSEEFLNFTDYTCLKSIVWFGLGDYAIAIHLLPTV